MPSDSTSNWVTAAATVAGVVVAAVALAVTLNVGDDDKADDPAGSDRPPDASTGATRSASAGPAPDASAGAPVLWQGSVLLDGTPVGFDSGRPERGNTSTDMSSDVVVENGSTIRKWFFSRLAVWRDTAPPEKDECVSQIETRGVEEAPIDVGSRFCLRTDGGRYVYIAVVKREGDGYDADVTLWSNA